MADRHQVLDNAAIDRLAKHLTDFIVQIDPEGQIIYLNRTDGVLERVTYLGSSIYDWVALENREAIQETLVRSLCTRQGSEVEYRFLSPGGEETWHSARITPLVVEEQVDSFLLAARDITERRRFEEETKQRNRELAALLSVSQQLTGRLDLQGLMNVVVDAIVEVLPAAEASSLWLHDDEDGKMVVRAWAGHTDERIEGFRLSPDTSLVGLVYQTSQTHIVDDARCEQNSEMLGRPFLDADRSVLGVPLLVEGRPIGALFAENFSRRSAFSGSDRRVLESLASQAAIAIDNARLYQALQESQRQLTTLMGNLPGMAYRCRNDRDWTMEFVSDGCIGLTGYSPEELVHNSRISYGDLIDPDDRVMVWESMQAAVDADMPFQIEYRIDAKGGSQKWVWEQGQGIKDPEGNVIALEGFITDITERRHAEEALEQHSLGLEHSNRLVTSLSRVAAQLQASPDSDQITRILGTELEKLGLACFLSVMDSEKDEIEIVYSSVPVGVAGTADSLMGEAKTGSRLPVARLPIIRRIRQERAPVFLRDPTSDPWGLHASLPGLQPDGAVNTPELNEQVHSIHVPVRTADRVDGVLSILGPGLVEGDLQIFSVFASQVEAALENGRLQAETHRRLEEQIALRDASAAIVSSLDYETVMYRIAEQMARAVDATSSYICSYDADSQISTVKAEYVGEEACSAECASDLGQSYQEDNPRFRATMVEGLHDVQYIDDPEIAPLDLAHMRRFGGKSILYVPFRIGDELIGFAEIWESRAERRFTEGEISLCKAIAAQSAVAIQNARLFGQVQTGRERLQALTQRLVQTQEYERRRIARELHDEIGQILTGLKLTLEMSRSLPFEGVRQNMVDAQTMVDELLSRVRELSLDLRPSMLDDLGLLAALKWHFARYTSQTGVKVHFQHGGIEGKRFEPEVETAAYRIVQEALTNVARHAEADRVDIEIGVDLGTIRVQIDDAGVGFDTDYVYSSGTSGGLPGMRERAVALGGQVLVEAQPGAGTHLTVLLPLTGRVERRTGDRIWR